MASIVMQAPDVTTIPTPPHQAAAIFIIFFFTILALAAFLMRVWTRIKITRQWGLDDSLMIPAEICSLAMFVPFFMYVKLGFFGWKQEDVPADYDPSAGLWWFYLAQIFYNPVLAFVKCSVLVFILRFESSRPGLRWTIYGLIAFTTSHAIAVFFGVLLQCLPIEANWKPDVKASGAKCIDNSFHVAISSLTILTDLLVLALPFYVFLGLKMPKPTKIAVICVFLSGAIVTAVSIVRLTGLIQLFYFPGTISDPFYDIKVTLSAVEVNLAIASACVPCLRPMFRSFFPALFGGSSLDYPHSSHMSTRKRGLSNPLEEEGLAMKGMRLGNRPDKTEFRTVSPTNSEEAIEAYNGIMRTLEVRQYRDTAPIMAKETQP
ncbi:hypothetical protein F5Y15DRAFT_372874 [Xylariaceae sp. FL0016]|nr:hypothetical protein F5Y15DRAFT_372874 [Xylariaceae sp. FL0016]